jgi:hypothetical protein
MKLVLEGRLTAEDARQAFEQTNRALAALAEMCADMER